MNNIGDLRIIHNPATLIRGSGATRGPGRQPSSRRSDKRADERAGRAVLLILVLLWGWFGASPAALVPSGPGHERVLTASAHDEVIPASACGSAILRVLEAQRPQPQPLQETPPYILPSSACIHLLSVGAAGRVFLKSADRAHALFVLIGPRAPRAPPPAQV